MSEKINLDLEKILMRIKEIPNVISVKHHEKKGIMHCVECDNHTYSIEKRLQIRYVKEHSPLGIPVHEDLSFNPFKICKSCGSIKSEPINYNSLVPTENTKYKGKAKLSIY